MSSSTYAFDFKEALDRYGVGIDPTADPESQLVDDLIVKNIQWFVGITGLIAVVFFIYGGVLFITAGGDEQKLQKAVITIRNAIIGLILILLSGLIINFIFSRIENPGGDDSSGDITSGSGILS